MRFSILFLLISLWLPHFLQAEAVSLLGGNGMGATRGVLFVSGTPRDAAPRASLFIGRAKTGLFAERPSHEPVYTDAPIEAFRGSDIHKIRQLIQQAESRRDGYDAVQHGAIVRPKKLPTQMTLGEIFAWIKDTPGQPHAIGRYQFIPKTLRRVVNKLGVKPDQRFSAQMQDQLADVLLAEAGLQRFRDGSLGRTAFMNNLAKIWAGLPNSTGKSHYDGYAGNKATMTWARFDAVMASIEPG